MVFVVRTRAIKHEAFVNVNREIGVIGVVNVVLQNTLHVVISETSAALTNVTKGLDKAVPFSNVPRSDNVFSIEVINKLSLSLGNGEIERINDGINGAIDSRRLVNT